MRAGLVMIPTVMLAFAAPLSPSEYRAGAFSDARLDGWTPQVFNAETDYRLVERDRETVLEARCDNAASALVHTRRIDLRETPILRWRWRVEGFPDAADETTRAGDDFGARVYVVKRHRLLPWRTRAINYVWTARVPRGSDWANPYAAQARMVAMRSGPGAWHTEEVNVREDFLRFHGMDVDTIDGIAIMTDCDDTGGTAHALYGDIIFTAAP
ncbi:MAG: DUF3047 domain-containing protein [Xanthomonadaceae bacterium]|nr:DUF3047 domain-containing protein [Xanthomonadaceae bacterium]